MTLEPEVLTDETPVDHLPRADALAIFTDFQTQLETLKATAETLTVTDALQLKEMALARETRLEIKRIRCAVENKRKELTEGILRQKQAIDAKAKVLKDLCEPLEARLEAQEKFAELENARREKELREKRTIELSPFLTGPVAVDLGTMPEAEYVAMHTDFKNAHEERIARQQREAEEAEARVKAEAEERERIRVENARLKAEAEKREAEIAAERLIAQQKQAEKDAAAKAEREMAEAILRKEREASAAALKAEQEKAADAAAKIKAKADAEIAAARAREQQEREIAADAERELALRKEAEFKAAQEKEQAALAPDKEKLFMLGKSYRAQAMELPQMSTPKGSAYIEEVAGMLGRLADWCEKKAGSL